MASTSHQALVVSPGDELKFCLSEDERTQYCSVKLSHPGTIVEHVAYKIETEPSGPYLVKPYQGVVAPYGEATIEISLVGGKNVSKDDGDTLVIQFCHVPSSLGYQCDLSSIWAAATAVGEKKLPIRLMFCDNEQPEGHVSSPKSDLMEPANFENKLESVLSKQSSEDSADDTANDETRNTMSKSPNMHHASQFRNKFNKEDGQAVCNKTKIVAATPTVNQHQTPSVPTEPTCNDNNNVELESSRDKRSHNGAISPGAVHVPGENRSSSDDDDNNKVTDIESGVSRERIYSEMSAAQVSNDNRDVVFSSVSAELVDETQEAQRVDAKVTSKLHEMLAEAVPAHVLDDPPDTSTRGNRRHKVAVALTMTGMLILIAVTLGVVIGLVVGKGSDGKGSDGKGSDKTSVFDESVLTIPSIPPGKEASNSDESGLTVPSTHPPRHYLEFTSTQELYKAVDEYLLDPSQHSVTASTYGYPIGNWSVSKITNFSHLFSVERNANALTFSEDLGQWDVSAATTLENMFEGAKSFEGAKIALWKTSNVLDMTRTFREASNFQSDLSSWDVSRVTSMTGTFNKASKFDGNISAWDVTEVTSMRKMFAETNFNGDISGWSVIQVRNLGKMFHGARSFKKNLCSWGKILGRDTHVESMFVSSGCPREDDPDLSKNRPGPFCRECD